MEQDLSIDIANRHSTHVIRLISDLSDAGWVPVQFPSGARLLSNRQLLELRAPHHSIRVRVSIYKVGDRGEPHRLDERRIEITTTFGNGLARSRKWADIVLGYNIENDAYVGLDPRRLSMGGKTHNASSSVDPAALFAASTSKILIRPHETPSLRLEYQAIFRPQRLAEYLFNWESIHDGLYRGDGLFSGSIRRPRRPGTWMLPSSSCQGDHLALTHVKPTTVTKKAVPSALVEAYEIEEAAELADLSPDELEGILRKCREVGDGGEHFVYRHERRRLHNAGKSNLADKIDWVSQKAVGKGYDIKSFEIDGRPRFIEVKATIGKSATFFMSNNEWAVATRLRSSYWIYRVVQALDKPRISAKLQDPFGAEGASNITRVPDGWRVTIC
jgi:hypothetical protein